MSIATTASDIRALWQAPHLTNAPDAEWRTPDRTGYAVAWQIASLIVAQRFPGTALDAIPLAAPEVGWDRFVLTRRMSCAQCAAEPANAFGQLLIDSGGAVRFTEPAGNALVEFIPAEAEHLPDRLEHLLRVLPALPLSAGDHRACQHHRAPSYPQVIATMARLVAAEPSLAVAREIYIDADLIDGMRHPLWAHTARQEPGHTYDWFGLRHAANNTAAFVRISGQQAIFRTDRATWASQYVDAGTLTPQLLHDQLRGWLGDGGLP